MLKASQLREKNNEELDLYVVTMRREIYNLRAPQLDGKKTQTHLIREKRREIARVLTIQNERLNQQQTGAA